MQSITQKTPAGETSPASGRHFGVCLAFLAELLGAQIRANARFFKGSLANGKINAVFTPFVHSNQQFTGNLP